MFPENFLISSKGLLASTHVRGWADTWRAEKLIPKTPHHFIKLTSYVLKLCVTHGNRMEIGQIQTEKGDRKSVGRKPGIQKNH